MSRLNHDERKLFICIETTTSGADDEGLKRLGSLSRRLALLETMAANRHRMRKLVAQGRDLRLSAAIACASGGVERMHVFLNARAVVAGCAGTRALH